MREFVWQLLYMMVCLTAGALIVHVVVFGGLPAMLITTRNIIAITLAILAVALLVRLLFY